MSVNDLLKKKQQILDELDELEEYEIEMHEMCGNSEAGPSGSNSTDSETSWHQLSGSSIGSDGSPELTLDEIDERQRRLQNEIEQLEKQIGMKRSKDRQLNGNTGSIFSQNPDEGKSPGCNLDDAQNAIKREAPIDESYNCPFKRIKNEPDDNIDVECPIDNSAPSSSKTVGIETVESQDGLEDEANEEPEYYTKTMFEMEPFFQDLPDGWKKITHDTGLSLFQHKETGVITASRPYLVDDKCVENHRIPVFAIPCFQRKREMEASNSDNGVQVKEEGSACEPGLGERKEPRTEVIVQKVEDIFLPPKEIQDYVAKIFKTKTIKVKSPATHLCEKNKRTVQRLEKSLKSAGLTSDDVDINEATKKVLNGFYVINIICRSAKPNVLRKSFLLNPIGLTSVSILGQFVSKAFSGYVKYVFGKCTEDENTKCFFTCTALLVVQKSHREEFSEAMKEKLAQLEEKAFPNPNEDSLVLAIGKGLLKQEARLVAAENAVKTLITSNIFFNKDHIAVTEEEAAKTIENGDEETEVNSFERLRIEDPRVLEMCMLFSRPDPYFVLEHVCRRSSRLEPTVPVLEHKRTVSDQIKVTITAGPFCHTVLSAKLKFGKHEAAQAILKKMYPELTFYSEFLDLYQTPVETNSELQEMFNLPIDEPNIAELCIKNRLLQYTPLHLLRIVCTQSVELRGIIPQVRRGHTSDRVITNITVKAGPYSHTAIETFKVGKHLASQAILKEMHPELDTYWALIKKYFIDHKLIPQKHEKTTKRPASSEIMDGGKKRTKKIRSLLSIDLTSSYCPNPPADGEGIL